MDRRALLRAALLGPGTSILPATVLAARNRGTGPRVDIHAVVAEVGSVSVADHFDALWFAGFKHPGDGGGGLYVRTSDTLPLSGNIQSGDGSWWKIAEDVIWPEMLGARGDGSTSDHVALGAVADLLDRRGGGTIQLRAGAVYLCEKGWTLPCGVDLLGPGTLRFTAPDGDGLYCSVSAKRRGQRSRIHDVTFGRSGSNGGRGLYTEQNNAAFFTQSPSWDIRRCWFRDLDAEYTYPPKAELLQSHAWAVAIDVAHSNGTVISDNDVIGNFSPRVPRDGQMNCIGVRVGTNGTNGVIGVQIQHNRLWYLDTALYIGEDVLALWFEKNECVKCYRGIFAPRDDLKDGEVLQADTRINDNFITTCTVGIDLSKRQMMHIVANHLNSDPSYHDNGRGFIGIRLDSCARVNIRGNKAILAAGHMKWSGGREAIRLNDCKGIVVLEQEVSRYFKDGIVMSGSTQECLSANHLMWQLSGSGHRFEDNVTNVDVGTIVYVDAEPANGRFGFANAINRASIRIESQPSDPVVTANGQVDMFIDSTDGKLKINLHDGSVRTILLEND